MDDWINGACDRVDTLAAQEPYYLELNTRRMELEAMCRDILASLSPSDRETLAEYEYTILEMAYQRTQAVFRLGKQRRSSKP